MDLSSSLLEISLLLAGAVVIGIAAKRWRIPVTVLLFRSRYTRAGDLWLVLVLFAMSRLVEVQDRRVFELLGGQLSGHTLKHLIAAAAVGWIARMVWLRTAARD